ncbi:PAAR domain-containing protein [Photorhabdus bodei]|uniref:PAAR domain-containing protein n=1 Tax=Photorhabdus bodei TaxID=2029681 RepID=UPI003A7F616D
MRSVVESKKIILKGDTTTTGGEVLKGSDLVNQQLSVACKGAPVFCPGCKQTGSIAEGSNLFNIQDTCRAGGTPC